MLDWISVEDALAQLALELPDLGKIREFLRRIREILAIGGVALAAVGSLIFLLAWVFSHLRRPSAQLQRPVLSTCALWSSYPAIALTLVAALGIVLPVLTPFIMKSFAIAVLLAGLTWVLGVTTIVAGGSFRDLQKARRALILGGTPWYCLALYLSTLL
jgi:hypothetical protein